MRASKPVVCLAIGLASAVWLADAPSAEACGCLSPPAPAVTQGDFAINQESEQIIFEVEPGWVTAHVLIRYAGDPAQFAWLVPVPEVPELSISPVSAFGYLDRLTAPDVDATVDNICPISEWSCQYHEPLSCPGAGDHFGVGALDAGSYGDAGGTGGGSPVTVISEQVVGDYQTVIFRATEAAAATQWLIDNGFIVNPTTSIYMESYVQANMVFVAAKLVPGAGIKAIKPLRMHYRAANPTIPLVLTAVAAEPHLTVTAFVYADQPYRPLGHPVVTIDPGRIARDHTGRLDYPMVLARTIDEAGGDGFAIEYRGLGQTPQFGSMGFCCGSPYDACGLGNNGQCECPRDSFDQTDCANDGDIIDGVALLDALVQNHTTLTRITTRVSPEQMTFDPAFEPDPGAALTGPMVVHGTQPSLAACSSAVIDQTKLSELSALEACSTTYCGKGECVVTAQGAACACAADSVAQRFTDLDGQPSVTCVPRTPPVDLRAGGLQLPDACASVSCGKGTCIDRNGVAVCDCDGGAGAIPGAASAPSCVAFDQLSETPGAQSFSEPLRALAVCAPPPPSCGTDGWLVKSASPRPGVDCGNTQPAAALTTEPPAPHCPGWFGCNGCQSSGVPPLTTIGGAWLVFAVIVRRRRSPRARA